jgi:hypothetical protein
MNDSEIIKTLQRMSRERPDGFGSAILTLIEHRQANAVKEFAEKLKTMLSFGRYTSYEQIDNLVKEMGYNDG